MLGSQFYTLLCLLAGLSFQMLSADEHKRSFILTLWDSPTEGKTFFYNTPDSKDLKEIDVQQMIRSKVYAVNAQQISIHSKGADGVKKLASVKLNPAYKCSLVILKSKENGDFESIVIEDRPQSLPYGSYLLYNHSELKIEGLLGKIVIKLSPHTAQLVTPKVADSEPLSIELWLNLKGEAKKKKFLLRNTLSYRSNKHLIMLFYSGKKANGKTYLKSKAIVKFKDTE